VRKALFGSQADDHFRLGVHAHAVLLEVLRSDFAAEVQDAIRLAIPMVVRVGGGLRQFLDHEVGRRIGRVAHSHVDHIVAGATLLIEQVVDPAEHVGRQPIDAIGKRDFKGRWRGMGRHRRRGQRVQEYDRTLPT
jgi:hypothetical protein